MIHGMTPAAPIARMFLKPLIIPLTGAGMELLLPLGINLAPKVSSNQGMHGMVRRSVQRISFLLHQRQVDPGAEKMRRFLGGREGERGKSRRRHRLLKHGGLAEKVGKLAPCVLGQQETQVGLDVNIRLTHHSIKKKRDFPKKAGIT